MAVCGLAVLEAWQELPDINNLLSLICAVDDLKTLPGKPSQGFFIYENRDCGFNND